MLVWWLMEDIRHLSLFPLIGKEGVHLVRGLVKKEIATKTSRSGVILVFYENVGMNALALAEWSDAIGDKCGVG